MKIASWTVQDDDTGPTVVRRTDMGLECECGGNSVQETECRHIELVHAYHDEGGLCTECGNPLSPTEAQKGFCEHHDV